MMKPEQVTVGMKVRCGLVQVRTATIIGVPKVEGDNVRVRVKFATGEEYDAPLWMLSPILKRPSARRISAVEVAREFARQPGATVTREELQEFERKVGK